jgi:metal-responsive CopG/Arc/MetJ family transcriptional regulator
MPIISISINESIKKFINKLISKNQYDNRSKLVRDALMRLMSSEEIANLENVNDIDYTTITKKIIGNMMFVLPNDIESQKKVMKIETEYKDQIISKNQHFSDGNLIVFIIFEGLVQDFRKIVVDVNSINNLKNFRYLIVN